MQICIDKFFIFGILQLRISQGRLSLLFRFLAFDFVFSASEQEFYAEKGFTNEPKRCSACRAARKARMNGTQPREMFKAVCAECGKETEVPFRPSEDRPVYCFDCFNKRKAGH